MINYSKYVNKQNVIGATSLAVILWVIKNRKNRRKVQSNLPEPDLQYVIGDKDVAADVREASKPKAHVDKTFYRRLLVLMKIGIPGWTSPEAGFMILVAVSLVSRSLCDLWMIHNTTLIENAIVTMNKSNFRQHLFKFLCAMPFISIVNNILKWSIGEMKLRMRSRLTHHLYEQYMNGFTYYKMSNLDNRIANADQLLTTDVEKFCDVFTDLYSNLAKPMLDVFIYIYKLTTNLGIVTPGIMMCYMILGGSVLTYMRRPVGRMTVQDQKLEGEFRYVNSRLITNSEEIAFYGGNNREKLILLSAFRKLMRHMRKFLEFRVLMGTFDNVIGKYFGTIVGFVAVSLPFLNARHQLAGKTRDERFREYYTMGRMMLKLAEAVGRVVLALRDMNRLAGLTARVTQLTTVLEDLNNGSYRRTLLTNTDLVPGAGRIICQDRVIRFNKVPLVTPTGDVLVKELSFEVISGTNVLVCGPNGCGKSSLFRILGELWPIFGGELTKPPKSKLFYIPQRPYMTLGTLRDQVIYPHTKEEMLRRGRTDKELEDHLERVQLMSILQREKGWDAIDDWIDVLSGGEKQRVAMARLFYHHPQFAILDECTSAVSVDVEGSMYQYCREVGITLFTVSHRKSLWKHHDFYLHMDGRGSFEFKPIDQDTIEIGS